jgi:hypothetical protein
MPLFLAEPLTMFCGNVRFRGTLFEKHWALRITVYFLLNLRNQNKKKYDLFREQPAMFYNLHVSTLRPDAEHLISHY